MNLPKMTHLQYAVVKQLLDGWIDTDELIRRIRWKKSRPGLYQLMGRIRAAGYIDIESRKFEASDQTYYVNFYQASCNGVHQVNMLRKFYGE